MDIKFNYEEIIDKSKDFLDDIWQFIQDNSNYFMLGMTILIVILIIALIAKGRTGRDDTFDETFSEPVKRKGKIKYQDIDWGIEQEDEEIFFEKDIKEPDSREDVFEVPTFLNFDEEASNGEKTKKEEALKHEDIVQIEQINLVKAKPSRKFGPDNVDTSRSGRIFTEEELKTQIRE